MTPHQESHPAAAGRPRETTGAAWRRAATLLAGLLLAVLAGCGSGDTQPADEPQQEGDATGEVIVISEFTYQVPATVPAGAQITVRNEDGVGHTVTSDESGIFVVAIAPGEEAVLTVPDEPGEYPFHCTPHPTMTATLVVE